MVKWQGTYREQGKDVVVIEGKEEAISRRTTLFLSGASFIMSLVLLSGNITGNVVSDYFTEGSNWLGAVFFILAITGFLFYVQKKKVKKKKK